MVIVIDLKISNIASVCRALKHLKIDYVIAQDAVNFPEGERIILPGVGSFAKGSQRLKEAGLMDVIRTKVQQEDMPILGICLGMQLLAATGEEGGLSKGLGLIDANVSKLRKSDEHVKLPHIGWNDITYNDFPVFESLDAELEPCFYFVHSYEMIPNEDVRSAQCHYGVDFVAAVQKDHILGMQFHPEKSQKVGLKVLENSAKDV